MAAPQLTKRASMSPHILSVLQLYLQYPPRQVWPTPLQSAVTLQLGCGRVSGAHAPCLQYPVVHCESPLHAATHAPARQWGVAPEHWVSPLHVVLGAGWQAPFVHVPLTHVVVGPHDGTHCPFAQSLPAAHSLPKWHTSVGGVHTLPTHCSPPVQSAVAEHAQGPLAPPQVWHLPVTQACPPEQSLPLEQVLPESPPRPSGAKPASEPGGPATHLLPVHTSPAGQSAPVEHCFGAPASALGEAHVPDLQTVPRGHCASSPQTCAHPWSVHTEPLGQLWSPLQPTDAGAGTSRHP